MGGPEPPTEGLGGVGGAEALDRVPEEGFPCRLAASEAALLGLAGVRVRISSKVCTMCTNSRLPAPPAYFTQRRSFRKAGADHQARSAGAWGGGGLRARGPAAAVVGTGGAGCVQAAGGTRSSLGLVEGGRRGHGTAVAGIAAPGGAGAAVAWAGGGGCVPVARGRGSSVLLVGGEGRGHGKAVACVAAPGERVRR